MLSWIDSSEVKSKFAKSQISYLHGLPYDVRGAVEGTDMPVLPRKPIVDSFYKAKSLSEDVLAEKLTNHLQDFYVNLT